MKLITQVEIAKAKQQINYNDNILLLGSCFADNIGKILKDYRFNTNINPFGTLYNPVSIRTSIERLISGKNFKEDEIIEYNGLYSSFYHHGSFSKKTKEDFLNNANYKLSESINFLNNTSTIIITLGTAWVYKHISRDLIVSNCHKISTTEFNRLMLSITDCINELNESIALLLDNNNQTKIKKIIFTVSPIRHLGDGAHGNQLSKSTLLLALDEVLKTYNNLPDNIEISYFPAYEIMMDELRDYRFYAEDFKHPSELAIKYIFDKFCTCYIDNSTLLRMQEELKITKRENHIPFHI